RGKLSFGPLRGLEELRQAHEVVGRRCKGEGEVGLDPTDEARLAQAADRLDPAERLLDPFSDALASAIAGIARCAPVDRRPARLLRHMRAHPHLTQLVNEIGRVIALVRAQGDSARPITVRFDHLERGEPLGMTGYQRPWASAAESGASLFRHVPTGRSVSEQKDPKKLLVVPTVPTVPTQNIPTVGAQNPASADSRAIGEPGAESAAETPNPVGTCRNGRNGQEAGA